MAIRPAVRVLCVDHRHRVLLLCWRDPVAGTQVWEPPGGGIEPGESAWQAACRELVEETGLSPAGMGERSVGVQRDVTWKGTRYQGVEQFFLARFDHPPRLNRDGLRPDERTTLENHAWVPWGDLGDQVEPPDIAGILTTLDPSGPWAGDQGLPAQY